MPKESDQLTELVKAVTKLVEVVDNLANRTPACGLRHYPWNPIYPYYPYQGGTWYTNGTVANVGATSISGDSTSAQQTVGSTSIN